MSISTIILVKVRDLDYYTLYTVHVCGIVNHPLYTCIYIYISLALSMYKYSMHKVREGREGGREEGRERERLNHTQIMTLAVVDIKSSTKPLINPLNINQLKTGGVNKY